jgi:hypothetical protein
MRSLFVAAVLAVGAALGIADTASAQYYGYNYRTYVNPATGSVVTGKSVTTPFGAQAVTGYYNPWFGYGGQSFGMTDMFGNTLTASTGYNPWVGNYNTVTGYANPNWYGGAYGYNPLMYNPYMYMAGVPTPTPYLTSGNLSMYNAALINQARYNAYMNSIMRRR